MAPRITARLHSVRAWRLDDDGAPTGDPVFLPIRSLTLHTPGGSTTMTTQLDPSALTDEEAGYLSTRPTKALVVDLLQELRDERSRTDVMHRAQTDAMMDLRTSEDGRKALQAQLDDADPEARLVGDLQAAVDAYKQRMAHAAEQNRMARAGGGGGGGGSNSGVGGGSVYYSGGEAAVLGSLSSSQQPYRPALDSPLGRALLHLAARHSVDIEATVVYPDARPEQQLVSVPRYVADQLQTMPL